MTCGPKVVPRSSAASSRQRRRRLDVVDQMQAGCRHASVCDGRACLPDAAALTVAACWLVEVQPPVVAHHVGAAGVAEIGQTALGGGGVVCGLSECLAGGG